LRQVLPLQPSPRRQRQPLYRLFLPSASARSLGLQLHILNAGTALEIDAAFAGLVEQRIGMLLSAADPFFMGRRDQIVALAARHAVPAIYFAREFVTAGGLMSYGTSISDAYRATRTAAATMLAVAGRSADHVRDSYKAPRRPMTGAGVETRVLELRACEEE
jgi:precorrin-6x reductase